MNDEQTLVELVKLAKQGQKSSVNALARQAKGRLYAYIYRVTLDHHLSQDLSQEALLAMVKSIRNLKKADRFWPWLYRIAHNTVQQHYRDKQRRLASADSAFYEDFISQRAEYRQQEGFRELVRKELSQKVVAAMRELGQRHRAVLALRCYDRLSYAEIASAMECNEVKARVLFFRAKQALRKQLVRRGVGKGLLLMALGVFGKLTSPSEAAASTVTVTAASAKVGLTTAVVAAASTKVGIAAAAVVAAGLATTGTVSVLSAPKLPERPQVTSLHYTTQLRNNNPGAGSSLSKGAYEQWYYYPDGIDGPVFMRMQRWGGPQQQKKLCSWLQDSQANYYHASGKNKVYMNNYRVFWSSLKVWRLPTDDAEFTAFLSEVEGGSQRITHARDRRTGLLARSVDNRFVDARNFRTTYEYNTLDAHEFEYDLPDDAPVIDDRDQMHRRGWTYFRIDGEIGDTIVTGQGQIPFAYSAAQEHPAWLVLKVGDNIEIVDCPTAARLRKADGGQIAYPSSTFFEGLSRPWMGMHTINIVRRDAIRKRVPFKTTAVKDTEDVTVTFTHEQGRTSIDLVHKIDMENDLLKSIRFRADNRTTGSVTFSYLQSVDGVEGEFIEPAVRDVTQVPVQDSPGMLWLVDLARGSLGE
jgi:RNA polymerase sigma-70 factor (ECF subfamily)